MHVVSVAQFIFEFASNKRTSNRYCKALYDSHKSYLHRLKEVGRDVNLNKEENVKENEDCVDNCMCSSEAIVDYPDVIGEKKYYFRR